MMRCDSLWKLGLLTCTTLTGWLGAANACLAEQFSPVAELPECRELPDPFLRPDGTRVQTLRQWKEQREHLQAILVHYMYGRMPPRPDAENVEIRRTDQRLVFDGAGVEEQYAVTIRRKSQQATFRMAFIRPPGEGPFPTIVKNCHTLFDDQQPSEKAQQTAERDRQAAREAVRRGYLLCKFVRVDLAPDQRDRRGEGVYPLYPEYDWGAIAVWAWGHQVVLDVLERLGRTNMQQVVCTGHSRGGQTAIAAGIFDERYDVVAPSTGGYGSCGTLRVRDPDGVRGTIDYVDRVIARSVPYWFTPRYLEFAGRQNQLPFDAHTLIALIAPRPLLNTNAIQDEYNNTLSIEAGLRAGGIVYNWMHQGDRLRLHWRSGKHGQLQEDWQALLDFADECFFGKRGDSQFNQWVYPGFEPPISWKAPGAVVAPLK